MTAIKLILQFTLKTLVFSLLLAGVHYLVASNTTLTPPIKDVFKIHVFIVVLTIIAYGVMVRVGQKDFDKIGFAFAGLVLVKMMVSFAFLYPYIKSPVYDVKEVVINFFSIYLLFAAFEAREAYLLINKGPFSPEK